MPKFDYLQTSDNSVTITPLTVDYADSVYALINSNRDFLSQFDENTARKYPSIDSFRDSIANAINPERERYVILSRGIVAGSINLTPLNQNGSVLEIGYWIGGERFSRQGITSAAAELLSDEALVRPTVEEVIAYTHVDNTPSQKTLLKAGFIFLGLDGEPGRERSKFSKT